jgi:hypothetical protein
VNQKDLKQNDVKNKWRGSSVGVYAVEEEEEKRIVGEHCRFSFIVCTHLPYMMLRYST